MYERSASRFLCKAQKYLTFRFTIFRDFINSNRPVEATPVVMEDYLQRLFFDTLSSGYQSNIVSKMCTQRLIK